MTGKKSQKKGKIVIAAFDKTVGSVIMKKIHVYRQFSVCTQRCSLAFKVS